MKEEVKNWIFKAEEDLNLVIKLLRDEDAENYTLQSKSLFKQSIYVI